MEMVMACILPSRHLPVVTADHHGCVVSTSLEMLCTPDWPIIHCWVQTK